jgi:peptide/nickel transport system substrate-binding protein
MTKVISGAVLERDPAKRAATYEAAQREHQRVSPFVIMFQQIEVAARRRNVNGFALGIMSDMNSFAAITKN